jgi:hypothetical protein
MCGVQRWGLPVQLMARTDCWSVRIKRILGLSMNKVPDFSSLSPHNDGVGTRGYMGPWPEVADSPANPELFLLA